MAGLRGCVQFNKYTHTFRRFRNNYLGIIHPLIPLGRTNASRMTRMTGPDCAVACNLINTHTFRGFRNNYLGIIDPLIPLGRIGPMQVA